MLKVMFPTGITVITGPDDRSAIADPSGMERSAKPEE